MSELEVLQEISLLIGSIREGIGVLMGGMGLLCFVGGWLLWKSR
jgi:hypothetical protein